MCFDYFKRNAFNAFLMDTFVRFGGYSKGFSAF